jgi:Ca-activated chloride channel family protein
MRRYLVVWIACLFAAGTARASGLLIPAEKSVPPLAMLDHQVTISIEDQAATTQVEQTFRNHTDRDLEATYVFPVPKGASVRNFTMWVGGKETRGELVEADKARQAYADIVRRTQDPGLLEYMGNDLLRLRVFPVAARSDQKVALRFTAVAPREGDVVEYVYPLKTDGKATRALEKFSLRANVKSQHPVQNPYSPTHAITVTRPSDQEAVVRFEREQALLDKDFQLFYAVGNKDVGLTALAQRPLAGEPGYVLLLLSPRVEISRSQVVPRDVVMVLDTSGSMRGVKMDQARRALKYCLAGLEPQDRFALLNFSTTVNRYGDGLVEATEEQREAGRKWVERLEATGGTAINDALQAALALRTPDAGRSFTVVFFTDGLPTVGETRPEKILQNVAAQNSSNTRIFTFGVGDDVNATLLDRLADTTRAVSTYVRPAEDIEAKVSGLYGKITHPVLCDLKLAAGPDVRLQEMYPPQLPDLFAGGQVVALARYDGHGPSAVKLTGTVGGETREYVYETTFPEKTTAERDFVEHLWARRKVGYLLDQVRANGEKKELVDEVVALAKKYGIATPYTSYLVVPDGPVPVVRTPAADGRPDVGFHLQGGGRFQGGSGGGVPYGLAPQAAPGGSAVPNAARPANLRVEDFAKQVQKKPGDLAANRDQLENHRLGEAAAAGYGEAPPARLHFIQAKEKKDAYDQARAAIAGRKLEATQAGKLGVDLSVHNNALRAQDRLTLTAQRNVLGRNCLEVGGVWIDEGFDPNAPTLIVKAQSNAYFKLLEKHPELKGLLQLGNHLVWVTPSGTALVVDAGDGKEELPDEAVDGLFVARK